MSSNPSFLSTDHHQIWQAEQAERCETRGGGGDVCQEGVRKSNRGGQKSITSRRRKAFVQKLPDNSEFHRPSASSNLVTCTVSGTCQNILLVSVMWGYTALWKESCVITTPKRGTPTNQVHAIMSNNQRCPLCANLYLTASGSSICPRHCRDLMFLLGLIWGTHWLHKLIMALASMKCDQS